MKTIDQKLNDKNLMEAVTKLEKIVLRLEKITEKCGKNSCQNNSSISLNHLGEMRM